MSEFQEKIRTCLTELCISGERPSVIQAYTAISTAAMRILPAGWQRAENDARKRACYFSAEYLLGRLVYSNLMNMGLLEQAEEFLSQNNYDPAVLQTIEDAALGNGGLGRLAACFLDSAATHRIPLDGYGIRYRYGLFRQYFEDGFQKETADDWQRFGDPWSIRRESESVLVRFRNQTVRAVPYDMPVIGYAPGEKDRQTVNVLRLWQAEALHPFDLRKFNEQEYDGAFAEKNRAEEISAVLYPNDDTPAGKRLRLKQQYFFSSASLQCLINRYMLKYGADFSHFSDAYAIQLNDTHPVVSIPEFLRIIIAEHGVDPDQAFAITQKTFAYTNHTIMAEALEKWDIEIFLSVIPELYPYVILLQNLLQRCLREWGMGGEAAQRYSIVDNELIHMARMAIFATHSTNGVAQIHSELLKTTALKEWYELYPERFNNKTNGITQRRWLALCNKELSAFITQRIGCEWITNLDVLAKLRQYVDDRNALEAFAGLKRMKKQQLADYVQVMEGVQLDPAFIFDVHVKRLHEYKRQLLCAMSILDIYFGIKEGRIKDFYPTAFIFGAKAFPGYHRAKAILKLINEIGRLIENDPEVKGLMQVLFVQNYSVSYAEKIIPAADISEQISTAGTEASGTGNMKLMLNGAVTLGTLDGANVEIVEQAGAENNYIFGATVQEITAAATTYNPKEIYRNSPRIQRVLDTFVDGTLNDAKTGMFRELYDSLLEGAQWHTPDQYYLLLDFESYVDVKLRANRDYRDRIGFARKCLMNIAGAGKFSSDRTICEYAKEIWNV